MKAIVNGIEVDVLPLLGGEPYGTQVVLSHFGQVLYYKSVCRNKVMLCKFLVWVPEVSNWYPTTIDVSHLMD